MKKVLSFVLVIALVLGTFAGLQVTSSALSPSGSCGENVTYAFDAATGELTISGKGTMENYDYDPAESAGEHSPFYKQAAIKSVVINEGVESVGRCAFDSCAGITSVKLPRTLYTIEDVGFGGCTALQSISLRGTTSIGDAAFDGCTSLTTVTFSNNLYLIGTGAFSGCEKLTNVTLPASLNLIGAGAFKGCKSITSIDIPGAVTYIGGGAFSQCTALTSLNIPANVTSIQDNIVRGCTALSSIKVDADNPKYDSRDNCNAIIYKAEDEIITACKTTKIPDTVKAIGSYAFRDCAAVVDGIDIPDSVADIKENAFEGTPYYNNKANWENGLLYMDNWLVSCDFSSHTYDLALKPGTRGIARYTFFNGTDGSYYQLKSLTIPATLKYIDVIVFGDKEDNSQLKDIYYYGTKAQWQAVEIEVGNECLEAAKVHFGCDPSHVHKFGSWKIIKAATCSKTGVKVGTCACGETKTESIPKIAHKKPYIRKVVKPAATKLGGIAYICPVCKQVVTMTNIKAPTGKLQNFKCVARTATAQKVGWTGVKTASGYQVQISSRDGKKWAGAKAVKATQRSCVFYSLATGNNYKFRVRFFIKGPDGKNYFSPWSATLNSPTLPAGTSLTKLTAGKKCFAAQWKKAAGVNGYQLQYSLSGKFAPAKTVTIKSANTLKFLANGLAANKVYYVRIRTYKNIGGVNYFSAWSKVDNVKTK